jgi:hypothetical protein
MTCYVLDGDNIRHGLNRGLGFSTYEEPLTLDVLLEPDVKALNECLPNLWNYLTRKDIGRTSIAGRLQFRLSSNRYRDSFVRCVAERGSRTPSGR